MQKSNAPFVIIFCFVTLLMTACTQKKTVDGFGRLDSPIRYKTVAFNEQTILAEVNGVQFTKEQILDKSPVLKDLNQQLIDVVAGLAYMKVSESEDNLNGGTVTLFLKTSTEKLPNILARLGSELKPNLNYKFSDPVDESTVAAIGDKRYRKSDLDLDNFVYRSIEQRQFEEISQQLNSQVSRILLSQAAQAAGIGIQEFIKQFVTKNPAPITDADLKQYLKQRGITESDLDEKQLEQIKQTMSANREQTAIEDYVAANILKGPISVAFNQPVLPLEVSTDFSPIEGYKSAPVSIVVFSGSNCPDCLKAIDMVHSAIAKFDGFVKLNWIHQINPNDGLDKMIAEASLCAESLKRSSTLDFLNAVAANGAQYDEDKMYDWARANQISDTEFRDCVNQHKFQSLLDKHVAYTQKVGVVSNPTIWINGSILSGYFEGASFEKLLQMYVDQSGETKFSAWLRRLKARLGWG